MRPHAHKYKHNLQECLDILYSGCKALHLPDRAEAERLILSPDTCYGDHRYIGSLDVQFLESEATNKDGLHWIEEIPTTYARYAGCKPGYRLYSETYFELYSVVNWAKATYSATCRLCHGSTMGVSTHSNKILDFFSVCPWDTCPLHKHDCDHPSPLCRDCQMQVESWFYYNKVRGSSTYPQGSDMRDLPQEEIEALCIEFLAHKVKILTKKEKHASRNAWSAH